MNKWWPAAAMGTAPASRFEQWGCRTLALGWWLFIAAFFVAPDKHALRTTFYVVVALPALIWARAIAARVAWRDPLSLLVAATLLFLSVSAFWGADAGDEHSWRALKIMLVLIIAFAVPRYLHRVGALSMRHLIGAILTLATVVAVSNLILNLFPLLSGEQAFNKYIRPGGWGQYDNQLQYGGLVGASALLALCEYLRASAGRRQALLLIVLVVLGLSLALTLSRGPIAYFFGVSALVAIAYRERWRRSLLLFLLACALALPALLHPAARAVLELNVERPAYRPAIWAAVIAEMPGKELIGQGWRDDQSVQTPERSFGHPHNFLLGIYRFTGLIGLGLFLAMTGSLFYRCAQLSRECAAPLAAWLLYGICLNLTNGRFPVSAPGNDWFFYWLPAALVFAFVSAGPTLQGTEERAA